MRSNGASSEWSLEHIEDVQIKVSNDSAMNILEDHLSAYGLTDFTSAASLFEDANSTTSNPRRYHLIMPQPPTDSGPHDSTLFDARSIIGAFDRHSDAMSLLEELDRMI